MSKLGIDLSIGSEHLSNRCGKFKIIGEAPPKENFKERRVYIQFENTGWITDVSIRSIENGHIKDPYAKNILGVACFGIINEPREAYMAEYNRWYNMLMRVYCPNSDRYYTYGAKGVTICERWHCFEYYYEDIKHLPGYENYLKDPKHYQLDKDFKQMHLPKNQRVYSPETCMWIPNQLNTQLQYLDREDVKRPYPGVYVNDRGQYRAIINMYGHAHIIGVYATPEQAAAAYNDYVQCHCPYMLQGDVPPLTPKQIVDLDLRPSKYEMCKIIKKK